MAYYYENTAYRILTGQLFILLYALLASLMGISIWTFLVIIALSIASSMLLSRLVKGPLEKASRSVDEILAGRRLYEEKDVTELQTQDQQQLLELQDQLRVFTYMNVALLVGLAYFFLFWGYIPAMAETFSSMTGNEYLGRFLAFLVYLEGFFIINQASIQLALSRVKHLTILNVPRSYVVTDKGIVFSGLLTKKGIGFPLPEGVSVDMSEQRRFVELTARGKKTLNKLRLYSRNPRRLYEIIVKNGLQRA
ncbi:MAG: DUF2208 family protein [Acidilobaceae archaeon]